MDNYCESELVRRITAILDRGGLLYRIFARVKARESIQAKIDNNPEKYSGDGRKIQDALGVRITTYFPDDSILIREVLRSHYEEIEQSATIDSPGDAEFGPTRCNLVFRLEEDLKTSASILHEFVELDDTFEIQFRTVLSEGWHEVEHDLRYKCKSDWADHSDLSRTLNGLVATLETCDWTALKVFDELSHRNYKQGDLAAMLRGKLRLRFKTKECSRPLAQLFEKNQALLKKLYRVERGDLVNKLLRLPRRLPLTLDNVVFLANRMSVKSGEIERLEPAPITEIFREASL